MMTHQPRHPHRDDERDNHREQPRRKRKQNMLDRIPLDWMLTLGSIAVMVEACREVSIVSYLLVAAWITLCSVVMIYTDKTSGAIQSNYRKFFKKFGKTSLLSILFGTFALTTLFFAVAEPSHAVFLTGAQDAIIAAFATGRSNVASITAMIALVFNVVRLILLLAVIFGVVKAIQARDDQEQVKAQMMVPFMILIGVAVIDVMTALTFSATGS